MMLPEAIASCLHAAALHQSWRCLQKVATQQLHCYSTAVHADSVLSAACLSLALAAISHQCVTQTVRV